MGYCFFLLLHAGFRNQMVNAVKEFSLSEKNGLFINSCFAHCQTERADTWFSPNSPQIGNKVCSLTFISICCVFFSTHDCWDVHEYNNISTFPIDLFLFFNAIFVIWLMKNYAGNCKVCWRLVFWQGRRKGCWLSVPVRQDLPQFNLQV